MNHGDVTFIATLPVCSTSERTSGNVLALVMTNESKLDLGWSAELSGEGCKISVKGGGRWRSETRFILL